MVACVWSSWARTGHLHRTLPDGCVEIVYSADRPALLYGPDATWSDVRLEGGRTYRGVRLRPGRAGQLLRIDLSELAGRVVNADDVLGI